MDCSRFVNRETLYKVSSNPGVSLDSFGVLGYTIRLNSPDGRWPVWGKRHGSAWLFSSCPHSASGAVPPFLILPSRSRPRRARPPVSAPPALPPFALSFSKEDSLHPYKAQSRANLDLASLLYEGLTAVGGDYAVRLNLAASIDEGEPLRPVVAIRSDAHFSDGSPVTAADIAASFSAAKGTAAFGPLLTNITAAAAQGTDRVAFTLASPDPPVAGMPLFSGGQAGSGGPAPRFRRVCV